MFAALFLSEAEAAQEKSWQRLAPMLGERFEHGCAVLGDTLYVFGGLKKDRDTDSADHWVLDLDAIGSAAQPGETSRSWRRWHKVSS